MRYSKLQIIKVEKFIIKNSSFTQIFSCFLQIINIFNQFIFCIVFQMIMESETDDTFEMEILDSLLSHLDSISKNNIKTLQLYADLKKQKHSISSLKIKDIYSLLTENKANSILFQQEKPELQSYKPIPTEAMVRLCWRFIQRVVMKCSYYFMNQKLLQCVSPHLGQLINLNKKLVKGCKNLGGLDLMINIVEIIIKENDKLEDQLFKLLLERGYIYSLDEFYYINGMKKDDEEQRRYQRKVFLEDGSQNKDSSSCLQSVSIILEELPRRKEKKNTFIPKIYQKQQRPKVVDPPKQNSKQSINKEANFLPFENQNALKPTNYKNWRKKRTLHRASKKSQVSNVSQNINENFSDLLGQLLINQTLNSQILKDNNKKQDIDGARIFAQIMGMGKQKGQQGENDFTKILQRIKKTDSHSSKLSSRIVQIMETVSKHQQKKSISSKHNSLTNKFQVKPPKIHRQSINALIGENIFKKENYIFTNPFEFYFGSNKFQSGSAIKISPINISGNKQTPSQSHFIENKKKKLGFLEKRPSRSTNLEQKKRSQEDLKQIKLFKNAYIKEKYSYVEKINKYNLIKKKTMKKREFYQQDKENEREAKQRRLRQLKNKHLQRNKTEPKEQQLSCEPTFPQNCRHQFRGKDKISLKQLSTHKDGLCYQVYDARRRRIVL